MSESQEQKKDGAPFVGGLFLGLLAVPFAVLITAALNSPPHPVTCSTAETKPSAHVSFANNPAVHAELANIEEGDHSTVLRLSVTAMQPVSSAWLTCRFERRGQFLGTTGTNINDRREGDSNIEEMSSPWLADRPDAIACRFENVRQS